MSGVDWDGNMVHANLNKKTAGTGKQKKKKAKRTASKFFEQDEEHDLMIMLPTVVEEDNLTDMGDDNKSDNGGDGQFTMEARMSSTNRSSIYTAPMDAGPPPKRKSKRNEGKVKIGDKGKGCCTLF